MMMSTKATTKRTSTSTRSRREVAGFERRRESDDENEDEDEAQAYHESLMTSTRGEISSAQRELGRARRRHSPHEH
jgi:hypothetical protein